MKYDLSGQKFARLTVTSEFEVRVAPNSKRSRFWKVQCDCGREFWVRAAALKNGNTKSCGCLSVDLFRARVTKHGHSAGGTVTNTYYSWHNMMNRCYADQTDTYKNYGGRGIHVTPDWHDYRNFLRDMGERPEGWTIERLDVNGHYEPSNCVWATRHEQSRNTRQNRTVEHEGVTKVVTDWAADLGISESSLRGRLNRGWDPAVAVTTPKLKSGRYR